MGQLLALNVEAGRLALTREKQQVHLMATALASLFDHKILSRFDSEIDRALGQTQILKSKPGGDTASRTKAMRHSMGELSKLSAFLRGGM